MRYTQPQSGSITIDRGSPLARGLVSYMPLVGKSYSDAVDGSAWAVSASTSPVAYDGAPRGLGLRVKGATPAYVTRPIPAAVGGSSTQPVTMRFRLYFHSIPTTSIAIMSWGSVAQDGAPRFYIHTAGSVLQFFFSTYHWNPTVVAEREYIVTHTFDGATMNTYMDGVLVGTASGVSWAGNAASLYLGMGYDGQQASSDFLLSDFALWNRALTPQEVASDAQNPWQMAKSPQRVMLGTAATGPTPINGTFAATEGADTLAAAGSLGLAPITGTLARTEGADTLVASGTAAFAAITGTAAVTEAADTLAASGSAAFTAITGTLARTEGGDTATGAGTVTWNAITGLFAATESADSLSASGAVVLPPITGAFAATEAPDTLTASANGNRLGVVPEYGLSTMMRATITSRSVSALLASYGLQAGTLRDTYAMSTILRATSTNRTAALDDAPINLTVSFP